MTETQSASPEAAPTVERRRPRYAVRAAISVVATAAVAAALCWAAGEWVWVRGLAYFAVMGVCHGVSGLYLWRREPEVLRRRGVVGEGAKGWDKALVGLFGAAYFAELIVAALDNRYGWSAMSIWLLPVGAGLYALFVAGLTWAMSVNTHFEKFVRIQHDRDHRVIDTGPYRHVRHPGYICVIGGFILGSPLLLGSWWSFVPAAAAALLMVLRTALEDRTLRRELPGYDAYAQRVRYRLLPGLW